MSSRRQGGALSLLLALGIGSPAAAQEPGALVDRIIAVVGTRALLLSQVEEQVFQMVAQPGAKPLATAADSAAVRSRILDDLVNEELLVQEAQRDTSIKVTDQEVDERVSQSVKEIRGRFTSEPEYLDELRKAGFATPEEYRRWLADQNRRQFFRERLLSKLREGGKLKPIAPTEKEMRAFFDAQKGQLGKRPATISFRQIAIAPKASAEARSKTLAQADSIIQELRRGADFAPAAKRFSADPGSKENGGSLGWGRRGTWVPEFERVAFALRPGVVSEPIESPFGIHIIQVERIQPAEVQARHILLVPPVSEADVAEARRLADSLLVALRAGARMDSLQRRFHDPAEERQVEDVPFDKLPEAYGKALSETESGALAPVFELAGPDGRKKFIVLTVTARRAEGEIQFEDVRDRVKDRLSEQLSLDRYLKRLRRSSYVEVRPS